MGRQARVELVSLKSSLINLPISLYGPLLERQVRPQHLAVHLSRVIDAPNDERTVSAYVGWSGMASASSLARFASNTGRSAEAFETVELDPQFAQALRLTQGDVVEIGLIHNLAQAETVRAEPVSSDDWEIIDLHAAHIENTLLSQARVAAVDQEIALWVLGRTLVRLRVVSIAPKTKTLALLLGTDTELVIAPKPRAQNQKPQDSVLASHSAAANGTSVESIRRYRLSSTKEQKVELRVVPAENLLLSVAAGSTKQRAYVSRHHFAFLTGCSLRDLIFDPEEDTPQITIHLCLARLKRIQPPASISLLDDTAPTILPVPRVLNPADPEVSFEEGAEILSDDGDEAWLACVPAFEVAPVLHDNKSKNWMSVPPDAVALPCTDGKSGYFVGGHISIHVMEGAHREVERVVPLSQPILPLLDSSASILAGVSALLTRLTDFTIHAFRAQSALNGAICGAPALLLAGKSGAGKTVLTQSISRTLSYDPRAFAYSERIDCAKLVDKPIGALKDMFATWRRRAQWFRPTLLVLDDIDRLLPAESENVPSGRARQLAALFISAFNRSRVSIPYDLRHIVIIATAQDRAGVHPLLLSSHFFTECVNMGGLGKDARREILDSNLAGRTLTSPLVLDASVNTTLLSTKTEGYLPVDLGDLVSRAVHSAAIRAEDNIAVLSASDFEIALEGFVPRTLRDVPRQDSDVQWADIGGLGEARRILRETLEWPTKYGPIFAQSPLRLRSGILLYGYPGCGKTLLASAVARECGLNFVGVKGPEILNKYIGASEKSVRDLFERASAAKPCILFFDEFDSIAPKRGHDSTGVTDRVVNQMLTQMDGAEGLEGVYVLAATSRPDLIDAALLRPGRLDKAILCDMPNLEDRVEIIRALGRKVRLAEDIDVEALAQATNGFSGADLQALVYNAHLQVVHDTISANSVDRKSERNTNDSEPPKQVEQHQSIQYVRLGGKRNEERPTRAEEISLQRRLNQIMNESSNKSSTSPMPSQTQEKRELSSRHIYRVLQTTKPSVSQEERQRLHRIYTAFVGDRTSTMPVATEERSVGQRVSLM